MKNRLWTLPVLVALLTAIAACAGHAIPSLGGPTGIVALPTAEIASENQIEVVLGRQSIELGADDLAAVDFKALVGFAGRAELWLAHSRINNDFDSKLLAIGGKYQLTRAPEDQTTLAIGGAWMNWSDGLLHWVAGLPRDSQAKWADSTPADIRSQVRKALGLDPLVPEHLLTVSASCTPTALDPAVGGDVQCTANYSDSLGHNIATWGWAASPDVGSFDDATAQNPTYTVPADLSEPPAQIVLTVTGTCDGPVPASDSASCAVALTYHALAVSASCLPTVVPWSGGLVNCSATFTDSLTHGIATWQWDDGGAPGSFDNATAQNPQYTVAAMGMYSPERTIILTVEGTCDGPSPLTDSAYCAVTQTMYQPPEVAPLPRAAAVPVDARAVAPVVRDTAPQAAARLKNSLKSPMKPLSASGFVIAPETAPIINFLKGEDVKVRNAYIVATRDFTPMRGETWEWSSGAGTRMLGSAGLLYLNCDPDLGKSFSLTRPFVGLEFVGAGGTVLGLEYRWKDSTLDQKAVFSAVLRHYFSAEAVAELGTTNASVVGTGLDDQDVFVRIAYTIPIKAAF